MSLHRDLCLTWPRLSTHSVNTSVNFLPFSTNFYSFHLWSTGKESTLLQECTYCISSAVTASCDLISVTVWYDSSRWVIHDKFYINIVENSRFSFSQSCQNCWRGWLALTITLSSLSTDMFVEVDVYQTEKKIKKIHVTKKKKKKKKKLDVFIETDCKRQSLK